MVKEKENNNDGIYKKLNYINFCRKYIDICLVFLNYRKLYKKIKFFII